MALEVQQQAYVLHKRPYRETSLLVTFLTSEKGRQNAVIKGVRGQSKSSRIKQAWLQPFQSLNISWLERSVHQSDLVNLRLLEPSSVRFPLVGDASICGLYLNELLYRLLYPRIASESIYEDYQQALLGLAKAGTRFEQAWVLRKFEFQLLGDLGYGFDLSVDANGLPIDENRVYRFIPEMGFIEHFPSQDLQTTILSGKCILQFLEQKYSENCLNEMKKFFRQVLAYYLGEKPVQARALFQGE
ncbi:DNA repair protein RecO [Hydrogenovibrio kuenenii]|uniref:DNA repair protein RecO n=1 Tax=Hydrogenovibrio kuenenii TaxID=63658 RepID=UPI0004644E2C|nr:DNA repair protein RecO [Hydrogenovibrio kuenenii]